MAPKLRGQAVAPWPRGPLDGHCPRGQSVALWPVHGDVPSSGARWRGCPRGPSWGSPVSGTPGSPGQLRGWCRGATPGTAGSGSEATTGPLGPHWRHPGLGRGVTVTCQHRSVPAPAHVIPAPRSRSIPCPCPHPTSPPRFPSPSHIPLSPPCPCPHPMSPLPPLSPPCSPNEPVTGMVTLFQLPPPSLRPPRTQLQPERDRLGGHGQGHPAPVTPRPRGSPIWGDEGDRGDIPW